MTLNLVDAKTERQLHSAVIDEEMSNVSALQDSMVSEMAMMLDVPLGAQDQIVLSAGGTRSPTAYYAYVQARGILQRYFQKYENSVMIDTAIDLFHDAIESDGGYALAYAGLGEAFWRKYDWTMDTHCVDSAVRYSRIALDMSDRLAPVHVTLGLIYKGTGEYDDAVTCFEKAIAIDSVCLPASRELALTHEILGNYERAEATYARAIALKPDSWGGYFDLAKYYIGRGQYEDALAQLHKAELLAPNAVIPCNDLGALYLHLGHVDEATIMLEHSLELQPNYAAYSNLGVIHHIQGRYPEAAEMYEKALKIDDHDYRVWINLAEVLAESDPKKSRAAYRGAIEEAEKHRQVNPQDALLLCYLGTSYAAVADTVRALDLAEQAGDLAQENSEIMVRVSVIYELSGERNKALLWAGKAVEHGFLVADMENITELAELIHDLPRDSLPEGQ
jgi:tetratricopeptide (TPR) repeat protein